MAKIKDEVLKEYAKSLINDGITSIKYGLASIAVGALILVAVDLISAK
jgi:hypothetical protein